MTQTQAKEPVEMWAAPKGEDRMTASVVFKNLQDDAEVDFGDGHRAPIGKSAAAGAHTYRTTGTHTIRGTSGPVTLTAAFTAQSDAGGGFGPVWGWSPPQFAVPADLADAIANAPDTDREEAPEPPPELVLTPNPKTGDPMTVELTIAQGTGFSHILWGDRHESDSSVAGDAEHTYAQDGDYAIAATDGHLHGSCTVTIPQGDAAQKAPTLTTLEPSEGEANMPIDVTLSGTGLDRATFETSSDEESWNSVSPKGSPTSTSAVLALSASEAGDLYVRAKNATGESDPQTFSFTEAARAPTLTSLSPTSGPAEGP